MDVEEKIVKLSFCNDDVRNVGLKICDNIESDEDSIILKVEVNQKTFCEKVITALMP